MQKMYVYRVENKRKRGPYRGTRDYTVWTDRKSHHHGTRTPNGSKDKILKYHHKEMSESKFFSYKFGFKSKAQLFRWFTKTELKRLSNLGFKIKHVRAKEIIKEDKHVLFKPFR